MIRYRHRNCERVFQPATFCYDLPPASLFKEMFNRAEELITFPFGVTLLHPKDHYQKSVGREHSFRAMKQTTFELYSLTLNNKKQQFYLKTKFNTRYIVIKVSTDLNENVRLDYIDFV